MIILSRFINLAIGIGDRSMEAWATRFNETVASFVFSETAMAIFTIAMGLLLVFSLAMAIYNGVKHFQSLYEDEDDE